MSIDLDKARAARREAKGEGGPTIVVGGKEYELAPELPFEALESLRGLEDEKTAPGALVDLTRALLGEHYETVKAGLSMDDLNELVGGVMGEYGIEHPLPSSAS